MPSKQNLIPMRLTNAQTEALTIAVAVAEISQAELLRQAVADKCRELGVEFPDDYPTHGGNRHK